MSAPVLQITFHDTGAFAASRRAEAELDRAGFSVGRMCGRKPRGILFGSYDIQKWRSLTEAIRLSGLEITRTHLPSDRAQRLTGRCHDQP